MTEAASALTPDPTGNAKLPPSAARIYDALLGGTHTTPADQDAAAELLRLVPDAVTAAHQNRQFIRRAVRFLVREAGIRQLIDIGMGLPSRGTVHEIAGRSAPGARVLYVDNDPFVLSTARTQLASHPTAAVIGHDLRDPAGLVSHPARRALIDLNQPTAILLGAVLHFIDDDAGPRNIVGRLAGNLAPGSYLAISHATSGRLPPATTQQVRDLYAAAGTPIFPRPRPQIARFLDGLNILPPGLVNGAAWRAGLAAPESRRTLFYAALTKTP